MIVPWENGGQEVGGESGKRKVGILRRKELGKKGKNMQIHCHLIKCYSTSKNNNTKCYLTYT